jgi:hypothetical protein
MIPTPRQFVIALRLGSEDWTGYIPPSNRGPLVMDPALARKFATWADAMAFIDGKPGRFTAKLRERCSIEVEAYREPEGSEVAV